MDLRNNMIKMKLGDLAFFYHSQKDREIVGIVEVVREHYPDFTDDTGKFSMVDFQYKKPITKPVSLKEIKAVESLQNMALIKQSRLSVMPVESAEWNTIIKMSEGHMLLDL